MPSAYNQHSDEQLLALIKSGDRKACSEVYERYWPLLYRHAIKMLRNGDESEDVVQDVFVNFWKKAPDLEDSTSVGAYLYTATRNRILNLFTRNNVHINYLNDLGDFMKDGYEVTDHLVREKILAGLIEAEIQKLPTRMREVFELKRKQNLSYKEIAEKMDISELTVKTQMNKAITILRSKFGDHLSVFLPFL
ncbi:RNA polymerase sigma factor [Pedobacter ureilyticus]|uniref:RNA polymerase sigma factor n=1 Tax=Pedobacter ureilyticus TaxID=1393051 RepID=A0ABW9J9W0_9SPHI|nr:RNA polymerase sigma-70 factor [Pedobacter helvus]